MKAGIHQRRGNMDSMTNIYVLLKNLEAFINSVPIDPNLPNCKDWEKTRAEMGKALKNTYRILVKQGFLGRLRPCGQIPLKQVFPGPLRMCGQIPLKQVFPEPLRLCGKVPLKQVFLGPLIMCRKVPLKQVFPDTLRMPRKLLVKQAFPGPLRTCGKVLQKTVREQFEPARKRS